MRKLSVFQPLNLSLSALVLSLVSGYAQANFVSNGSFESTTLTTTGTINPSNVTNWYDTGYNSEVLVLPSFGLQPLFSYSHPNYQAPYYSGTPYTTYGLLGNFPTSSPDGGNYVISDADYQNGPISQTITGLTVGQFYKLSFYQALAQLDENLTTPGSVTGYWQATLGSSVQNSQLMNADGSTPTFSNWSLQSLVFAATATSELLQFLAIGTGLPPMTALDGVSLELITDGGGVSHTVPEPEIVSMLMLGLFGIAVSTRKAK